VADGAGFLIHHQVWDQWLILKRSPWTGNPKRWSIPGGRVDRADRDLYHTAVREAIEEMGSLPGSIMPIAEVELARPRSRGRYLAILIATADLTWTPALNWEHTKWRWATLEKIVQLKRTSLLDAVLLNLSNRSGQT